jgi:hypothetical protein
MKMEVYPHTHSLHQWAKVTRGESHKEAKSIRLAYRFSKFLLLDLAYGFFPKVLDLFFGQTFEKSHKLWVCG